MSLGKRCDEIVRLIDETLADVTVDPVDTPTDNPVPETPGRPVVPVRRRQWRWVPPTPAEPEREAAGF